MSPFLSSPVSSALCLAHPPATRDQVDLGTSIQQSHKHSCLPEVPPAHSSFFLKANEVGEEMEGVSRSLCIYFQFQGAPHHWVQQASFRCFLTTQSSVPSMLTPLFQLWGPLDPSAVAILHILWLGFGACCPMVITSFLPPQRRMCHI